MLRKARILLLLFFALLTAMLVWRAGFYHLPIPEPVPQPAAVVATPTPAALGEADLILDLFNPTDGMLDAQINETTLTRQIEEALVVSFLLRRCDYLSYSEYSDTYRALVAYAYQAKMAATMTEAQLRVQRIVETANASYALIYSRTACDAPELGAAKAQLAQWRNAMLAQH